jgi:hypothetical protein
MTKNRVENQVEDLASNIPLVLTDDRFLLLMYWKICNGIDIPNSLIREILAKGSMPETITRSKRKYKNKPRAQEVV